MKTQLYDIQACDTCMYSSYPHGDGPYCTNPDSPINTSDNPSGTFIQIEDALVGCDKIKKLKFERKIPPGIFRQMASDSHLRNLPLAEIVEGYSEGMDVSGTQTAKEILREHCLLEE